MNHEYSKDSIESLNYEITKLISVLRERNSPSNSQSVEIKVGIGPGSLAAVLVFSALCAVFTMVGETRSSSLEKTHTLQLQRVDRELEMLKVATGISINKEDTQ